MKYTEEFQPSSDRSLASVTDWPAGWFCDACKYSLKLYIYMDKLTEKRLEFLRSRKITN